VLQSAFSDLETFYNTIILPPPQRLVTNVTDVKELKEIVGNIKD